MGEIVEGSWEADEVEDWAKEGVIKVKSKKVKVKINPRILAAIL